MSFENESKEDSLLARDSECLMKMETTLSFVRHGQVYNPKKIFYGRLPGFRLSDKGKEQADSAAKRLNNSPLAAVFSSPLVRARQTARQIIKYHPKLLLKISVHLTEVLTPFEGFPSETIDTRAGDVYAGTPPPFEQPIDIVTRVLTFIASVRSIYTGKHVVAVTHGDIITFMTLAAMGQALTVENKRNMVWWGITDGYPAPASITTFTYHTAAREERPHVSYWKPFWTEDKHPRRRP